MKHRKIMILRVREGSRRASEELQWSWVSFACGSISFLYSSVVALWLFSVLFLTNLLLVGCDGKGANSKEAVLSNDVPANQSVSHLSDAESNEIGASFDVDKGLLLSDKSEKAMGLEFAKVTIQKLNSTVPITAQVYRSASEATDPQSGEQVGYAYAAAVFSAGSTEKIDDYQKVQFEAAPGGDAAFEGTIWKVNTALIPLLGKIELLIKIPDPLASLPIGTFLQGDILRMSEKDVIVIPKSAVLETANGKFAFMQNGKYLQRVLIQTGATDSKFVQVTTGLSEGDVIVIHPLENLYMIELRTRDGSHAH